MISYMSETNNAQSFRVRRRRGSCSFPPSSTSRRYRRDKPMSIGLKFRRKSLLFLVAAFFFAAAVFFCMVCSSSWSSSPFSLKSVRIWYGLC